MRATICIRGDYVAWRENEASEVPWWSFTKLVIASAALKLVERGSLKLDSSLPGRAFTLRQLLQHEAGLPDYGWLESYQSAVANREEPWAADEIISRTFKAYPPSPPGTRWAYSNIGYYHVGQLIVDAAGMCLSDALGDLALVPAGARGARLASHAADLETVQMGEGHEYDPRWVLHGLLVGPISDAAIFVQALLSGRVLNEPALAEMLKVHLLPQFRDELWAHPAYGLGIMGAWDGPRTPCGHSGEGPGSGIAVYGKLTDAEVIVAACWESPGASRSAEKVALNMLQQL